MHLGRVVARHQVVDLGVVKENLERVQSEIETLLERLDTDYRAGFALKQVELSLSVSAEGSIGIVTPGPDAAITLVYSPA
ncbi:MAG: Pepco domain-containing protein [Acidimicrobiia bacterium]